MNITEVSKSGKGRNHNASCESFIIFEKIYGHIETTRPNNPMRKEYTKYKKPVVDSKITGPKNPKELSKYTLVSGGDIIKHVYSSVKKSPNYPKYFVSARNGKHFENMNNFELQEELRKVICGEWKKVYHDGYNEFNEKISLHYFLHVKTGKIFDLKIKKGWSNK